MSHRLPLLSIHFFAYSPISIGEIIMHLQSNGSDLVHLFALPGGAQSIAGLFTWSPDVTAIAYECLSDSSTPFLSAGLWIMNNHGAQQRHLAHTDGGHGYAPVW